MPAIAHAHAGMTWLLATTTGMTWLLASTIGMTWLLVPCERMTRLQLKNSSVGMIIPAELIYKRFALDLFL